MVEDTKSPIPPIRLARSKEFRTVYTNTFRMRATNNEFVIPFGYQTQLADGQNVIQDEVELIMSLFTLKFLAAAISKSVADIEKEMGKIELPQELLDQLEIAPTILHLGSNPK